MSWTKRFFHPLVAALLCIMAAAQISSIRLESQTWDEATHLAAGHSYLKTADYRMNPEHPPLGKLLHALPLLFLDPDLPLNDPSWEKHDELEFGSVFLYKNRVSADTMLFASRLVTVLLTLLLGLAIALWTKVVFGPAVALFATALYAFDPNIIAHGRYVTSDLLVTLFFFLTCIAWARYLRSGRRFDLTVSGALLGLALASKFSALLLLPILPVLYVVARLKRVGTHLSLRNFGLSIFVVNVLALAMLAALYAPVTKNALTLAPLKTVVDRKHATGATLYWLGKQLHLPAHTYFVGLNMLASHDHVGQDAYLLGNISNRGWWYYFPVVAAVKTPAAVLALIALCAALALWVLVRRRLSVSFVWFVLILPPAIFFASSMTSHLNIGVRHILPVYPFVYVLIPAILVAAGRTWFGKRLQIVAAAALIGVVLESAAIYPHYLAFFNVLAGGPSNGPRYLLDSNIDWGQDVKKLKTYMAAHGIPSVCSCYFGNASFSYYGIKEEYLPKNGELDAMKNVDCFAAISATLLYDLYMPKGSFEWLRQKRPVDIVGHSIYIFDLRKCQRKIESSYSLQSRKFRFQPRGGSPEGDGAGLKRPPQPAPGTPSRRHLPSTRNSSIQRLCPGRGTNRFARALVSGSGCGCRSPHSSSRTGVPSIRSIIVRFRRSSIRIEEPSVRTVPPSSEFATFARSTAPYSRSTPCAAPPPASALARSCCDPIGRCASIGFAGCFVNRLFHSGRNTASRYSLASSSVRAPARLPAPQTVHDRAVPLRPIPPQRFAESPLAHAQLQRRFALPHVPLLNLVQHLEPVPLSLSQLQLLLFLCQALLAHSE